MRSLVLTGRRCDLHDGQTFDTHTKFRSVNAVSSGLPQSSFWSVAQLSPFGKKLVALGNKIHHPLAFGISHRQGDQAGFRFQPAPVLGIPLSVGRIRRHGVLCPSHPGVERLSQVYVPNKGPASGGFCEGSPAPVESCRALGQQPMEGPLAPIAAAPRGGPITPAPAARQRTSSILSRRRSALAAGRAFAMIKVVVKPTAPAEIALAFAWHGAGSPRENTSCSGAPPHVRAIPGGRGAKARRQSSADAFENVQHCLWPCVLAVECATSRGLTAAPAQLWVRPNSN